MAFRKKLSKQEKLKQAAEKFALAIAEKEKEKEQLIQEEIDRVGRERKEAEARAQRTLEEQEIRTSQLQETLAVFRISENKMYKWKLKSRTNEEWKQYLQCDGLPDPESLGEMNTYLYLWRSMEEQGILTDVVRRTTEVLDKLKVLQELIDNPLNNTPEHVEDWTKIRNEFREELQKSLDRVAYVILRRCEHTMSIKGANEVRLSKVFDNFVLCLWSLLPLPTPSVPLPKDERTPLMCEFSEIGIIVNLPDSLFDIHLVIRPMLVGYDHFSDLTPSWFPKPLPEEELKDLNEVILADIEIKNEFQNEVYAENERRSQITAKILAVKPSTSRKVSISPKGSVSQKGSRNEKKEEDKSKQLAQAQAQLEGVVRELQELQATPVVPALDRFTERDDLTQEKVKEQLQIDLQPFELNLRKYVVLGGIYHIDVLQLPPQPHELHSDLLFTTLVMPTELLSRDFHVHYEPPVILEPEPTPSQIEAEQKRLEEEELARIALEEELAKEAKKKKGKGKKGGKGEKKKEKKGKKSGDKKKGGGKDKGKGKKKKAKEDTVSHDTLALDLAFGQLQFALRPQQEEVVEEEVVEEIDPELFKLGQVDLLLPKNVLWFEPPIVAGWNEENSYWTTEDFHDLKFNAETQVLTFRVGKFGPMGLAAYRYANLPYKSWELSPNSEGGVFLNISAAVLNIEFLIKDDQVCLNQVLNAPTNVLEDIVGTFYSPYQLRKRLYLKGVDVFPDYDAFCYVEGIIPKHRAAEKHLYHCMALMSASHSFAWSHWNLSAGRRNMVLQMKEVADKTRQLEYELLLVTPEKSCMIECTEESEVFNTEPIEGTNFYADLYHMLLEQGSFAAKAKANEIPFTVAETVYEMLRTTKILSFS